MMPIYQVVGIIALSVFSFFCCGYCISRRFCYNQASTT
jgi:hypothetical protein